MLVGRRLSVWKNRSSRQVEIAWPFSCCTAGSILIARGERHGDNAGRVAADLVERDGAVGLVAPVDAGGFADVLRRGGDLRARATEFVVAGRGGGADRGGGFVGEADAVHELRVIVGA